MLSQCLVCVLSITSWVFLSALKYSQFYLKKGKKSCCVSHNLLQLLLHLFSAIQWMNKYSVHVVFSFTLPIQSSNLFNLVKVTNNWNVAGSARYSSVLILFNLSAEFLCFLACPQIVTLHCPWFQDPYILILFLPSGRSYTVFTTQSSSTQTLAIGMLKALF